MCCPPRWAPIVSSNPHHQLILFSLSLANYCLLFYFILFLSTLQIIVFTISPALSCPLSIVFTISHPRSRSHNVFLTCYTLVFIDFHLTYIFFNFSYLNLIIWLLNSVDYNILVCIFNYFLKFNYFTNI